MAKKRGKPLTADEMFGPPIINGTVVEGREPQAHGGSLKRAQKMDPSTMLEAKARSRKSASGTTANSGHANIIPHQWKPGQSGNPNGRPKSTDEMKRRFQSMTELATDIIEMKARLQAMRLQKAIDVLADPAVTLEDFNLAVAVIEGTDMDAVQAILDRGHGKPQQKIDLTHREVFDDLNPEEFENWLVNTSQRVTKLMIERRQKAKADGMDHQKPGVDRARKPGE